jgi:hypothetical protein
MPEAGKFVGSMESRKTRRKRKKEGDESKREREKPEL